MNGLRDTAARLSESGRLPIPSGARRQLEIEKAAARLAAREVGAQRQAEPWDTFLRRIGLLVEGTE